MKQYQAFKDQTELKIEIYYNKGGMNYYTSRAEKRGYYISVCPVIRTQIGNITTEQYTAFSGVKMLLKEVARKSDKAYNEAVELGKIKMDELINYIKNAA